MSWKELISYYFENKIYTKSDVAGFVSNESITESDYYDIVGERYDE